MLSWISLTSIKQKPLDNPSRQNKKQVSEKVFFSISVRLIGFKTENSRQEYFNNIFNKTRKE